MPIGTVRWYNTRKGFGFISTMDGPDIFVHYSALQVEGKKTLQQGDVVEYEAVKGEKGLKAARVIPKTRRADDRDPSKS